MCGLKDGAMDHGNQNVCEVDLRLHWTSKGEFAMDVCFPLLTSKSNKYSVVLWQLYIALEMEVGDLERAKRVLLRALGVCWWAKGEIIADNRRHADL